VVRAKVTIRFPEPEPTESANLLVEAAKAQAQALLADAPNATAVTSQQGAFERELRASLASTAPGARLGLETFGPAAATTATGQRPEQPRGTVLVVDDEDDVRRTIEALLSDEFDVLQAANAWDAEALVLERRPQALLADYELGGPTGLELLDRVRAIAPDVIGMLISGHHDYPEVVAAMGNDRIFRVLLKPYDPETLIATIRTAVSLWHIRRNSSRPPGT
jgi:CheY-like chemotaxis protein